MKYLVVERWEEFQHYKNRAPLWIKNYTRLLHDDTYLALTGHQRAVLHGVWLVYASSACRLVFDAPSLAKRLSLRVTSADLKALTDAGYITVSASRPLAERYQAASPEVEVEKEKKPPSPPYGEKVPKTSVASGKKCPECSLTMPQGVTLADHRRRQHDVESIDGRAA